MTLDWQKVSSIVAEAAGLDADGRATYLNQACHSSAEMEAEVAALLAAHDQAGSFLAECAAFPTDPEPTDICADIGRQLGPYTVEAKLGEGTMGVVLLAEDTRNKTKVALKTLPPAIANDEDLREYLTHEIKTVAAMAHPNIAVVRAIEEVYGQFYVVCEYVPGKTLKALIDAGPIMPETAAAIALQVAEALAAANAVAMIHGDLKPENIVCSDSGVVKVLDFGLLHSPSPDGVGGELYDAPLTEWTAYKSPEQLDGTSVDSRSDQFALGVLMYEMMAGRNPFAAPTLEATAANVKSAQPPPISTVKPGVPPDLDRVVSQCLEKDREKRFRSSSDLVRELTAYVGGQSSLIDDGTESDFDTESESRMASGTVAVTRPSDTAPVSRARGSWAMHQLFVMAVYAPAIYLTWRVESGAGGAWRLILMVVMIGAGAINSLLRIQLLSAERLKSAEFRAIHSRIWPLIAGFDSVAGLSILLMAFALARTSALTALALGSLGFGLLINAAGIEPAKTRAAFPARSAARRRAASSQSD
ncbi:MAG: serine/threonine-protein kinase [Acidobacteriota bacterium]